MPKNLANTLKQNLRKLTQNSYFKIYLVLIFLVAILVCWVSHWGIQVSSNYANLQPKEKFNPSLEITKAIISGAGTVSTIIGGVFLYLNYDEAKRKNSTDAKLAEARLITERFSKAIEHLGSEKLHVRLGGIYSLERISQDSQRDYSTVIEVLRTFIQTNSVLLTNLSNKRDIQITVEGKSVDYNLPVDHEIQSAIQAAAIVIIRRNRSDHPDEKRINLRDVNLFEANLGKVEIWNIDFSGSNFSTAKLTGTKICVSDFSKTDFTNAHFISTDFNDVDCANSRMKCNGF
ncbi:MAG: pentapeptide repeat-containing protein [Pseudanabaena sp. ELA607]|jgi:hypothetical protein